MEKEESQAPPISRDASEHPIPAPWRPAVREIVQAFARHDYQLGAGVPGVDPIPLEKAERIGQYIREYGEELIALPDETWNSSVCTWTGSRWDLLVDLWTLSEGRSDLVLALQVSEDADGFRFSVHMVYVP